MRKLLLLFSLAIPIISNAQSPFTVVKYINSTTLGSSAANLININGTVYFSANNRINGAELWKTDGTDAGTVMVKDIFPGSSGSATGNLVNVITPCFLQPMMAPMEQSFGKATEQKPAL
jgi:ELWxxDGT repeat protein